MKWLARRHRVLLAGIVTLALIVAACGSDDEDAETTTAAAQPAAPTTSTPAAAEATTPPSDGSPRRGGIIRGVNESGAFSLDNTFTSQFSTRNVAAHIFETVVTMDDNLAIQPQIADWAVTGDGSTFTFTVREDLTWHDGNPVTSDDIMTCIERWRGTASPASFNGIHFGELASMEKVDDRSFTMSYNRPLVTILNGLSAMAGRVPIMMPKSQCETPHNEDAGTYIGSGPYMLKEWVRGDRVELQRYEGYVARTEDTSGFAGARHAYADEIHILEIPDPATRLAGLEAGQFDYVAEIANDFHDRVNTNSDLKVYINVPGVRPFVWFNHLNPPTDSKEIRRAIVTSFDVEAALRAGGGSPEFYNVCGVQSWCVDGVDPTGPIMSTELQAGQDLHNINDRELARQLAEDAGYNGEEILLNGSQDVPTLFRTSQVFFENMQDAGFNVKLQVRDHAANDSLIQNQQDGWHMGVVTNSWANSMATRFRSAPTSSFASGFSPPDRMTELAVLIHFETDRDRLVQWLNEVQVLAQEYTGCCYFVGEIRTMTVTRNDLRGFTPHPVMFLVNSWLDR
jgi:peptide/nickel transport system substrate-binding protein